MADENLPGRKVRNGCRLRYEPADGRAWEELTNAEQMRVTARFNVRERAAMIVGIKDKSRKRDYMDYVLRQFGRGTYDQLAGEIKRQLAESRAATSGQLDLVGGQ